MVGAVNESGLHVNHGVTGHDAIFHGFLDTLLDWPDIFLGYGATDGLIHKLKTFSGFLGFKLKHRMPVLTATSGLANILALGSNFFLDRFPICYLWFANI